MTDKPKFRISTGSLAMFTVAVLLMAYVGVFFALSRAGMRRTIAVGGIGYDFLDDGWSINADSTEQWLEAFYYPLIELDAALISGQRPLVKPSPYYMTTDVQYYPSPTP
ncbi:hypothetical protein [Blastopirellula marina]|uniref:Uncharacterized protein n=1 Tax=Blastopirellula marina TaxID=124 RepID=A0A2S8GHQ0_9BACT|nr:hypothetical protein [Blastopirellula marina]PQO43988.1 hypothetical protein C5Y93_20825 [Blastopirellula marina]